MPCMKCGRKTENESVFCSDCLSEMEKYPVRPGTVVRLPRRHETPVVKKRSIRSRFRRPSDQIELLRVRTRLLLIALIIATVCFLIAAAMVMWLVEWHKYIDRSWIGISMRNVSRETFPFLSIF